MVVTRDVAETHQLVAAHIAAVRRIPGLENAICVLALESNLGFEAQHIIRHLEVAGVRRWTALKEGAGGGVGWLTTNSTKEIACLQMREALSVGCIALSTHFVSVRLTPAKALATLRDELCRFAVVVEPPRTAFGKPRKTYTGKQRGLNDDVVVVLQIALSAMRVFHTSPLYERWQQ
mmetsp:Transcript_29684/g.68125  ORF Transcript_29684/g.68125 Transcript_29684/m.68125 type:complete len:177 (-) Transcript_29684:45-575(-)